MSAVDPIQSNIAAALANSGTVQVDPAALQVAIQTLNSRSAAGDNNEFVATMDDKTHRITVQIVDRASGQVIRQISPPSIFMMFRRLTA